jgi:hypothetical protein
MDAGIGFLRFQKTYTNNEHIVLLRHIGSSQILDRKIANLPVNGKITHEENIVDPVGMKLGYRAWRMSTLKDKDLLLPGLETLTQEQMISVVMQNALRGFH